MVNCTVSPSCRVQETAAGQGSRRNFTTSVVAGIFYAKEETMQFMKDIDDVIWP